MTTTTYSQHLLNTMCVSLIASNASTLIGSPLDRIKTGLQTDLDQSSINVCRSILRGGSQNFFAGWKVIFLRQTIKASYRTILTTDLAKRIDLAVEGYPNEKIIAVFIKSVCASGFDTTVTTPLEVIKTQQMKTPGVSMLGAVRRVCQVQGPRGLLNGWTPSFAKSLQAWTNLFLTYHITTQALKKNNLDSSPLKTAIAAAFSAIPITLATNPLDVVKSYMQHHLVSDGSKRPGVIEVGKKIAKDKGVSRLWRGSLLRATHRGLNLFVAWSVWDYFYKKHP